MADMSPGISILRVFSVLETYTAYWHLNTGRLNYINASHQASGQRYTKTLHQAK